MKTLFRRLIDVVHVPNAASQGNVSFAPRPVATVLNHRAVRLGGKPDDGKTIQLEFLAGSDHKGLRDAVIPRRRRQVYAARARIELRLNRGRVIGHAVAMKLRQVARLQGRIWNAAFRHA